VSQLTFLQREWAAVFEAPSKAESAVRADLRTECFYARRVQEFAEGRTDRQIGVHEECAQ
jgi:hypothetical protein